MNKTTFKKIYIIYVLILIVLVIIFTIYVIYSLFDYETNVPTTFIHNELIKLSDEKLNNDFVKENGNLKEVKSFFADKKYTLKEKTTEIYEVYNGDKLIYTINLKKNEKVTKLSILKYRRLALDNIKLETSRGLFYFTLKVPSNYSIFVNNKTIDTTKPTKSEKIDELSSVYDYVDAPKLNYYNLDYYTKIPNITVENNYSENIPAKIDSETIDLSNTTKTVETLEEFNKIMSTGINFEEYTKNYSLFLSDNLGGELHGYYKVKNYFLDGSYFAKKMYEWATSIEITYQSWHALKNPPFTNFKVSNFKIYNDKLFTCNIYIEKHLEVAGNKDKTDTINNIITYVKTNNGWKVASSKTKV